MSWLSSIESVNRLFPSNIGFVVWSDTLDSNKSKLTTFTSVDVLFSPSLDTYFETLRLPEIPIKDPLLVHLQNVCAFLPQITALIKSAS